MGQSISRNRSTDPPTVSSSHHDTVLTDSSSSNTLTDPTPTVTSAPKHSRRSTVRKSLLDLVKRRSCHSSSSGVDTAESTSRRSWRNSRRWSKAPRELSDPAESSQNARTQDVPPSPLTEKHDEDEKESDNESTEQSQDMTDQPPTPLPGTPAEAPSASTSDVLTPVDQDIRQNMGSWLGGQSTQEQRLGTAASLAHRLGLSRHPSGVNREDYIISNPYNDDALAQSHDEPTTASTATATEASVPEAPPEPPTALSTPTQQAPTRQFPPPGTLVVVQGVVHTTDVPRPPTSNVTPRPSTPHPLTATPTSIANQRRASSTPRPSTPLGSERLGGARNRLSSLLHPRPSSMLGPRPPFTAGENRSSSILSALSSTSNLENTITNETPSNSSSDSQSHLTPPINDSETRASSSLNDSRSSGPISSSSIDVLGTLLSVAAAATAASLLTGSSEPILSSSLAPPSANPNSNSDNPTIPSPVRPTSPTPTAGLGESPNVAGIGRGERMRHAWGSIRERLGLRASATPPSLAETGTSADANARPNISRNRPDGTPMDAREMMLAEMARAFNLGLGLTGDPTGQPATSEPANGEQTSVQQQTGDGPATPANASSQLPPEGSFERFLVDLQADLRVALTQDPSLFPEDTYNGNVNLTTDNTTVQPPTPVADVVTSSVTEEPSVPSSAPDESVQSSSSAQLPGDEDHGRMPELAYITDSESEFDDEEDHEDENEQDYDEGTIAAESDVPGLETLNRPDVDTSASGLHHRPSTQNDTWPVPQNTAGPTGSPLGAENDSGRINWWRLYRFPPITAPRTQGPAEAANNSRLPSTPLASTTTTPVSSLPDSASGLPSAAGLPASNPSLSTLPSSQMPALQPTPADTIPGVVIPVIVVGLQSVNVGWRRDQGAPGATGESDDIFGADEADLGANHGEDLDLDGNQADGDNTSRDGTGTPRGRRWHSRAANAIRNLRPGRRAGPRGPQATDGAGSRTFLIYVIGGYYPPDHSIVTGGPNNLDSFEALLELAELLGQVKPPTVSREDIEKSGLEIVRSAQLAQYEKEGKISSNCTERCLICLDDYEPEEDIRVLACKHAFHKNCVDKWLQTGRNNCPACRSKGVSTDGPIPPAQVSSEA